METNQEEIENTKRPGTCIYKMNQNHILKHSHTQRNYA